MARILVSAFALLFLNNVPHILGELVTVFVEESVQFTGPSDICTHGPLTLIRRLPDDRPITVAIFLSGAWEAGEEYRGRIRSNTSASLTLLRVTYNDQGQYEFTCGHNIEWMIHLQPVILSNNNLSVSEGGGIKLPCYYFTADGSVKTIRWERNGELVVQLNTSPRNITHGTGFEGRVSLPPDWYERGDVTLTLEWAQVTDQGAYCCVFNEDRTSGNPAAVKLTVPGGTRGGRTSTVPPPACTHWAWFIAPAAVAAVAVAPLAIWTDRRRRGQARHQDGEPPQGAEDVPLRGVSSRDGRPRDSGGEEEGAAGVDRESDGDQQSAPTPNGYH